MSDCVLKAARLETPLGAMLAVGDDEALWVLEYVDGLDFDREMERLRRKTKALIIPGVSEAIGSIESELKQYFDGHLREFKTPLLFLGTPFQKMTWEALRHIPYGETRTYSDIAAEIGKPLACRAVGSANGANPLAIVVPCHRMRGVNGELRGYAGGIARKKWLMKHERERMLCPGEDVPAAEEISPDHEGVIAK